MDISLRNLRSTIRSLARTPAFTATVVLTLAIGIGASTAVFSVVNSVLLKPLPYPDADELVAIWHVAPGAPGITDASGGLRPSPSMYFTYAEEGRAFQSVGLWFEGAATVTGIAEPEQVGIAGVTSGVLETLRVPPLLGRWLDASDQTPGGPSRVLLSYTYWQQRFGGDPAVIGRTLTVDSVPAEIIGVMPAGFRLVDANPELISASRLDRSVLAGPPFCCRAIARLKSGITLAEADADIARMLPIWLDTFAPGGRAVFQDTWRIAPALRPLKQEVVGSIGNVLWVVLGTVGVVLLIACANVTNLLLVRAEGRERELAVRVALGADAWRVARVLLVESVSLATLGGVLGLALAYAALELLGAVGAVGLPRLHEISLDATAVGLALGVSIVSGLVLGAVPALKIAGPRLIAGLHGGARGASAGRNQHRVQNALVVAQVALALVLLVSSGLMLRTFQSLLAVEPGFTEPAELQTMRLTIPFTVEPDPDRVLRIQNDIVDALKAIPGVESAAFVSEMPLENRNADFDLLIVEGAPPVEDQSATPIRRFKYLSPGLLQTAGTQLVAGRDITWDDVYRDRRVGLVSENLARELFGSPEAALGKRIRTGRSTPTALREIVGVVQDVRDNALDEPAPAIAYWPTLTTDLYVFQPRTLTRGATFVVRSPLAGTQALVMQMQRAVWSVKPDVPLAVVRTMQDVYSQSLSRKSFTLVILGIAGSVALVLGVVGLYGVLAYIVAQRRREIAIRLAVGAQPRRVALSFLRYGVGLALVGVVLGLGTAAAVTRLMAALLHGVHPIDALTYGAVAVLLTLVAALASYLPARRAANVDPAEALAAE
jgi:predicted permease